MHLICPLFVPYFLLGIIAVPREIENTAYAKFWGEIRRIMGNVEVTYTKKGDFLLFIRHFHISQNTPFPPPPPQIFS